MNASRDETTGDALVFEWHIDHPPERVWKALTDPNLVTKWLGPSDIRADVGNHFLIRAPSYVGGPIECRVLEAVPNQLLRITWRGAKRGESEHLALDTEVTFVLDECEEGGTHLRIVHDGFAAQTGSDDERATEDDRPVAGVLSLPSVRATFEHHRLIHHRTGGPRQARLAA